MANNRKLGNSFEAEFCRMLFEHGFWAHNLAQNSAGQPADVIAAKENLTLLVDCKVCSGNGFPISRIESNQWTSMELWAERTNYTPMFALKLKDESVWMVSYHTMYHYYKKGLSSLSESAIRECGNTFEEWMELIR